MRSRAATQREPDAVAGPLHVEAFALQHRAEDIGEERFFARNARRSDERREKIDRVHCCACATNIVPLPSLVKTSARTASGRRPETRCTLATPPASAARAAAIFGFIPAWIAP